MPPVEYIGYAVDYSRYRMTVTILDDDLPEISIDNDLVGVDEGNVVPVDDTLSVFLSGPQSRAASVDYATVDGTATAADNDYQPTHGT